MKRLTLVLSLGILALLGLTLAPPTPAVGRGEEGGGGTAPTMSATDLRNGMRKLWLGSHDVHAQLHHQRGGRAARSADGDDSACCATRTTSARHQADLRRRGRQEAGGAASRSHPDRRRHRPKAAKANDSKAVDAGQKKWRANADDIATFLSGANPNWKKPTLTDMLYKHLDS